MRLTLPDPGPGPARIAFDMIRRAFLNVLSTQEAVDQVLLLAPSGAVWSIKVNDAGVVVTVKVQGMTGAPTGLLLEALEAALAHAGNTHSLDDIRAAIRMGDAQIWGTERLVCLTELVHYPRFSALNIWLVAGELEDCATLLPEVEAYARQHGCARLEAAGRLGWRPWCEQHGYRQTAALYRKDLS